MRLNLFPTSFIVAALASPAFGHALLRSAVPPVGSTIESAPKQIVISYSESVEPMFSMIEVRNASGARVDARDPHILPGDDKRLAVGLPPLPAGTYTVIWHAVSTDTHRTEGSYSFTVSP